MKFSGSKAAGRVALLLSTGIAGAGLVLASTLPGPVPEATAVTVDSAPSVLLPPIMDAAASFTDTGNTSPATAPGRHTDGVSEVSAAPMASSQTRVTSGQLSVAAGVDGLSSQPDHNGCVPEPVSVVLMASGLFGLIAARRFRK